MRRQKINQISPILSVNHKAVITADVIFRLNDGWKDKEKNRKRKEKESYLNFCIVSRDADIRASTKCCSH